MANSEERRIKVRAEKPVKVNLGDEVKETITGLVGIVIGRTEWLYGCVRVTIQPKGLNKDGKPYDSQTFDEPALTVVKPDKVANPNVGHGPRDDAKALSRG